MERQVETPVDIAVADRDVEAARAMVESLRQTAAEFLPFGLEANDFLCALERLAEPEREGAEERPR
ncbi:MAG: hypothetical protein NZ555_09355 [Geminicoccaceae bacterium]|nr:hypothetical protein [Geminicoccaceae bacterium]MCX8100774.1 hypothetical protein [Geminicoccaceae bacterium]MDW8370634.1 hypothetical protein [Geminicoccaceae bacterium]